MILADTSALLAGIDESEPDNEAVRQAVAAARGPFVLSPFVLAELDYLLTRRLGVDYELDLLAAVARGEYALEPLDRDDIDAAATLIRRYRDLGIGLADASILVLADKLGIEELLTLDERHFRAARTPSGRTLTILPADD